MGRFQMGSPIKSSRESGACLKFVPCPVHNLFVEQIVMRYFWKMPYIASVYK